MEEMSKMCIEHVRHCIDYKKIIMKKVIDTFNMPLVIEKIIFTYIGFFSLNVRMYKLPQYEKIEMDLREIPT